jgi:hypothetical protein
MKQSHVTHRHCEEEGDEAIPEGAWSRLLRSARNDRGGDVFCHCEE